MSHTQPPQMTDSPEGWYPDPQGQATLRWWDGTQWTAHTHNAAPLPRATQTPASSRSWKIVIGVVLFFASFTISLFVWLMADFRNGAAESRDAPAVSPWPTVYYIQERPGWDPLVARTEELLDRYQNMDEEALFSIVPRTEDGYNYYRTFVYFLLDQSVAQRFAATGESPEALDAEIAETDALLTEMERRFLANEDLEVSVTLENSDGSVFQGDGSAPAPNPSAGEAE